ncbi:MAG: amidohydrolase family protein [Naasia sp.]
MADLLLRSVRLLGEREPSDVLISGGAIARIAPGLEPGRAEVLDLEGRTLIRGLRDEHVHFTQWTLATRRLDLGTASSAAEVAELVAAVDITGDDVIVGVGFRDGLWPDAPTSRALDLAGRGHPVVLISGDLHCVWLSSSAGRLLGADLDESGLLREDDAFRVQGAVDSLPGAAVDLWAAAAGRRAASRGVVGIIDFEMTWNLDDWTRRVQSGFDAVHVDFAVYPDDLQRAAAMGLHTGRTIAPGLGVGPLKVLIDGSLNTRTAYCDHAYPDGDEDYGILTVSPGELSSLLALCRETGFRPAVHAIGDRAVRGALDAFAEAGIGGRVEHAQLIADADIARFAPLGVTASIQPAHLIDDRNVAERHWSGRTGRAFPVRALLDAGAEVVFGSDAPVAPLDPWVAIAAATHRAAVGDDAWHGEQRIDRREALDASTGGRASVRVGDPADLAVLDADPLSVGHADLQTMPVALTLLGGRTTHSAV